MRMFERHSKNSTDFQYKTDQCSRDLLSGTRKTVQSCGTKRISAQENSWPEEVRGLPPILGHRREPGQYERFAVRQNAHGGRVVVLQEQRAAAVCSAVVFVFTYKALYVNIYEYVYVTHYVNIYITRVLNALIITHIMCT